LEETRQIIRLDSKEDAKLVKTLLKRKYKIKEIELKGKKVKY